MKLNKMVLDDKKIDEAARGAADLYEQDLPMMSYDEDTEVDGQHHFCQEFGTELFKDGAKWAINEFLKNLWHPASEEPREFAEVLAEAKITESIKTYISFKKNDALFKNWDAYSSGANITRWLYIDDLLPKEG